MAVAKVGGRCRLGQLQRHLPRGSACGRALERQECEPAGSWSANDGWDENGRHDSVLL